jgi:hypothetical protein
LVRSRSRRGGCPLRFSEFAQWVEDGNRWRRAKDIGCSVHHVVPQSSDGHGLGDLDQDRLTLNDGQRETIVHTLLDVIPKSSDSGDWLPWIEIGCPSMAEGETASTWKVWAPAHDDRQVTSSASTTSALFDNGRRHTRLHRSLRQVLLRLRRRSRKQAKRWRERCKN